MPPSLPPARPLGRLLPAAALAAFLAGCATHTGKLPKAPPFPAAPWKPSIAVQVDRVYADVNAPGWRSYNQAARIVPVKSLLRTQEIKDQVKLLQRLQASGLFSRVVSMRRNDDLPPAADELARMDRLGGTDISLVVEPDMSREMIPPLNFGIILYVLPSYEVSTYQINARARFAGSGEERHYRFSDKMGICYWLPLLPMLVTRQADRLSQSLNDNLMDTLILRVYEQAAQAHAMPPAPASALPPPAAPGPTRSATPGEAATPEPGTAPDITAPLTPPGPAPAVSP